MSKESKKPIRPMTFEDFFGKSNEPMTYEEFLRMSAGSSNLFLYFFFNGVTATSNQKNKHCCNDYLLNGLFIHKVTSDQIY